MPTCLKHQQIYAPNEWCVYCGKPQVHPGPDAQTCTKPRRRFVFVEDPIGPYRLCEANGQFVIANETAACTRSFEFTLGRNIVCRGRLEEETK